MKTSFWFAVIGGALMGCGLSGLFYEVRIVKIERQRDEYRDVAVKSQETAQAILIELELERSWTTNHTTQ